MEAWSLFPTDQLWRYALAVIPLAILVGCITRFVPCRPATRHTLWLSVLVWLVTAPLFPDAPSLSFRAATPALQDVSESLPAIAVVSAAVDQEIDITSVAGGGGLYGSYGSSRFSFSGSDVPSGRFDSRFRTPRVPSGSAELHPWLQSCAQGRTDALSKVLCSPCPSAGAEGSETVTTSRETHTRRRVEPRGR